MSTKTSKIPRPTDMDLMLYADGELDGEQRAAVEAYLAEDADARRKLAAMGMVSSVVREHAIGPTRAKKGDDIADLVMASIAAEPKKADVVAVPARRKPANDNARGLLALAALAAAAAAAALLLWGRSPAPADHAVSSGRAPATNLTAPAPHDEADVEHGVEVSAVDFGAGTGAVFYVPSDNAAATTTVVWLSDDSSGGDE